MKSLLTGASLAALTLAQIPVETVVTALNDGSLVPGGASNFIPADENGNPTGTAVAGVLLVLPNGGAATTTTTVTTTTPAVTTTTTPAITTTPTVTTPTSFVPISAPVTTPASTFTPTAATSPPAPSNPFLRPVLFNGGNLNNFLTNADIEFKDPINNALQTLFGGTQG